MANSKGGLTDFTRSLIEKVANEKAKADLIKEQKVSAPRGSNMHTKSKVMRKEDKPEWINLHDGQVRLF